MGFGDNDDCHHFHASRGALMLKRSLAVAAVLGFSILAFVSLSASPGRADDKAVTFTKDVAPIVYDKCVSCHRPGEIAPFSLVTYNDARPWAKAIKKNVADQVMPPWHADPKYGKFANERRLTQNEIDTIVSWVDQGAPQGNPKDLPPMPRFDDGWTMGKPDLVIDMGTDFPVPAEGVVDYKYFTVPTNFTEDRWIQAAEIRSGNRAVVHHVIVFIDEPNGSITRAPGIQVLQPAAAGVNAPAASPGADATRTTPATPPATPPSQAPTAANAAPASASPGAPAARAANSRPSRGLGAFLVGFAPGTRPTVYPEGSGKRIKAGATLTFQMHYTPNGTGTTDRTLVGLKFAKAPSQSELRTVAVLNSRFVIPANAASHKVESAAMFTDDVKIWSLFPHMHVRGKSFEYRLVYPDGRSEIVLSVPKYDFNWQGEYTFAEPLQAPKGSRLECVAYFDNSTANKANPDASKDVKWGDQTWEEMMIGWTTYSVESGKLSTQQQR
jgi:hypothetical protein